MKNTLGMGPGRASLPRLLTVARLPPECADVLKSIRRRSHEGNANRSDACGGNVAGRCRRDVGAWTGSETGATGAGRDQAAGETRTARASGSAGSSGAPG